MRRSRSCASTQTRGPRCGQRSPQGTLQPHTARARRVRGTRIRHARCGAKCCGVGCACQRHRYVCTATMAARTSHRSSRGIFLRCTRLLPSAAGTPRRQTRSCGAHHENGSSHPRRTCASTPRMVTMRTLRSSQRTRRRCSRGSRQGSGSGARPTWRFAPQCASARQHHRRMSRSRNSIRTMWRLCS